MRKLHIPDKGFTLIELIMVVTIILIIAGITLPNYYKAKERALGREAKANLKLIVAAEKIYLMENNVYAACSCASVTDCNDTTNGCNYLLKLSLPTNNWTYLVVVSPYFMSVAYRTGTGGYANCEYALSLSDADGEPNPNANCP